MAHSRSYATSSSRQYHSSRQYQNTSSYISASEFGSHSSRDTWERNTWDRDTWEDFVPSAMNTALESASSVDTYDSALSEVDAETNCSTSEPDVSASYSSDGIPPAVLPPNRSAVSDASAVRSSDPETFAHLFPSMDRLTIRHDDRSADGNMNLRIDTVVPDPSSRRRRPVAIQLFHLRMHDLARREFSLRRYSRDSGREVCNSKGANPRQDPNAAAAASSSSSSSASSITSRPSFQRALRSVKTSFRRSGTEKAALSSSPPRRPSTASNASWGYGGSVFSFDYSVGADADDCKPRAAKPIPANTIKLEFSNYARVDIACRGAAVKRYDFEWWGHKYAWRRVVDKTLGTVSFQLIRGGVGEPVALIVPEGRSPNQVEADKDAGAWVPPCYMWICDKSILEAVTDVADVIVSTGLMALVDDSIKERWPAKKPKAKPAVVAPIRPHLRQLTGTGGNAARPRDLVHGLFNRTRSGHYNFSPLRFGHRAVVAY